MLARQLDAPDINGLIREPAFFFGLDVDHLSLLSVSDDGVDNGPGTLSTRHCR